MRNNDDHWSRIESSLANLYSQSEALELVSQLKNLIAAHLELQAAVDSDSSPAKRSITIDPAAKKISSNRKLLSGNLKLNTPDVALITYANSIKDSQTGNKPLQVLRDFLLNCDVPAVLPIVHILPFYPWDTDRGFSVEDYYRVKPEYGDWKDISDLSKVAKIMVDFVANHASIQNPLIQGALIERHISKGDQRYEKVEPYRDFVIAFSDDNVPDQKDLQKLARPRPNPVLTRYSVLEDQTGNLRAILGEASEADRSSGSITLGTGWVWTTFSRPKFEDGSEATCQVDLNFQNPRVLLEAVKILLFYCEKGASLIRLDAIGYIWKKPGSCSLHEPEAHQILEVVKNIVSVAEPALVSIAEVNEPQDQVFEYLGQEGREESDLIYQFTHFPLAVHAVLSGNGRYYQDWLKTLETPKGRQFITILGSHDGMGLKPARGFLPDRELKFLSDTLVNKHGALPNYASLPGGEKIIYEICSTPWNLINQSSSSEPLDLQIARYLAVVSLGFLVRGLPAIYINGLIGSPNHHPAEGLDENRTVNREIFDRKTLYTRLNNPDSQMGRVFKSIKNLLKKRAKRMEFDPAAPGAVPLYLGGEGVISAELKSKDGSSSLITLTNVTSEEQTLNIPSNQLPFRTDNLYDYCNEEQVSLPVSLAPYQTRWVGTDIK
jgi:glucosylglycerate phosphorylase